MLDMILRNNLIWYNGNEQLQWKTLIYNHLAHSISVFKGLQVIAKNPYGKIYVVLLVTRQTNGKR